MSLCELLAEASLGHCAEAMSSETLESCASRIAQGRPAFLKHIKEIGIEKLSDRQKIATLIAKAAKSGGVAPAPAKQKRALENLDLARELIQYIHDLSDGECSRKLEPLKPLGATPPMRGEPAAEGSASVALASRPEARVRLVAIYGSGCTAESFDAWRASAPTWLELRVLELQGIGTRESEGLWSLGCARVETGAPVSTRGLTLPSPRARELAGTAARRTRPSPTTSSQPRWCGSATCSSRA